MVIQRNDDYTLYRTRTHRCACYIVKTNKYSVLIDTGMRFERRAVVKSIQAIGVQKIDAIFLTHSHTDHVAKGNKSIQ